MCSALKNIYAIFQLTKWQYTGLGPERAKALPLFHAFTGCDTVSAFNTKGKKSAWETWKVFDEVTTAFLALYSGVPSLRELERIVFLLYDHTSPLTNIDEARLDLFTRKGRSMEAIPPTRAA